MERVFQRRCGASICRGLQAVRQSVLEWLEVEKDFLGGHKVTEG